MVQAESTSLQMQVNLFVSGRKLKDLDTFSKSDPQCILYEKRNNQWAKVGQTEQIRNQLNPDFKNSFTIAYFFEKVQNFKFVMIDGDGAGDFETIGEVEVTMGKLMGAKKQMWTANLSYQGNEANRGQIIVRTEALQTSNEVAKWTLRWQNAQNFGGGCMGMCLERNYYTCEIMKAVPGTDNFTVVARVPGEFNTSDVRMTEQILPLGQLCNADKDSRIKFALVARGGQIYNSGITTLTALINGSTTLDAGNGTTLVVDNFTVYIRPTFVDYLRSGWSVSLVAAIDYTASNGNPSSPASLHFMGANNQYESALLNVGSIVEPYDNDRSFPVFGFGGIPRHLGINSVNHCFAMNGNAGNPEITGIEGIVAKYRETLPQIGLGGPTLFAPLLTEFKNYVQSVQGANQYQILLLLTDGAIHDMPQTINLVCELSEMPCSVIIVGVGNADFSAMEELDGDGGRLRNVFGVAAARDIVQFVEFSKCINRGNLAEEVLKEVPEQVCSYMERIGYNPIAQAQSLDMPPQ